MFKVVSVLLVLAQTQGFQPLVSSLLRRSNTYASKSQSSLRANEISMSVYDRVRSAVIRRYPSVNIDRVVKCWDEFAKGTKLDRYVDAPKNEIHQTAECFVDGLTATCFHNMDIHPWAKGLEANHQIILDELQQYNRKHDADAALNWLGPRDVTGNSYGPEWKTLGLQDRSVWDTDRVHEFPQTVKILKDLDVPSCEVFFAKQGPKSGIKPHSDKNNFIITCHLALDVPEGECYIQVGNEKYYWKNGKTVVFDTSIMHSTENISDRVRYVLLIRIWHPELTPQEREAFKFIFDMLDHAAMGDDALDQFEFESMNTFFGKDNHKGLNVNLDTAASGSVGAPGKSQKAASKSKPSSSSAAGFGQKEKLNSSSEKMKKNTTGGTASKGFGAAKK